MVQNSSQKETRFGPILVIEPVSPHTHTIVMLHGRGSDGEEFSDEFLSQSNLSDGSSLSTEFPGARWVFPSSKELWSTAFQEHLPAWFEAHSLTDSTSRQDLQVPGITDSVQHVQNILDDELARLGGQRDKLVMGGISQGGAIAMLTLLGRGASTCSAIFVTNTWLPFASNLERALGASKDDAIGKRIEDSEFDSFARTLTSEFQHLRQNMSSLPPVFFGHGVDDAYVDVSLGRQASNVLERAGFYVEWKEYSGAELEGHWFKVPEEIDDIRGFLRKSLEI